MTEIELMQTFGQNLKNMLEDQWMSQKELAEETGISEATISYYANGERMPSMKNVINIAYVLDCDLNELIDTVEPVE